MPLKYLVFDAETFYSDEYSLSKMSMDAYVRDPRFQLIGASYSWLNEPESAVKWRIGPDVAKWAATVDWSQVCVVAQNAQFDSLILELILKVSPARYLCTMALGRLIDPHEKSHSLENMGLRYGLATEKGHEVKEFMGLRLEDFRPDQLDRYGRYCDNDVIMERQLFNIYMAHPCVIGRELGLIDWTTKATCRPKIVIDRELMLTEHAAEVQRKNEILLTVEGGKGVLMSNQQFAAELELLCVPPPMKISATTKKPTYAFAKTDEEFLALQEHADPRVRVLVAARLGVKSTIYETRCKAFAEAALLGPLPFELRYAAAHTLRFGGSGGKNLQNLGRGSALRDALMAPEDLLFWVGDYAQIEARVLAVLAGQEDLVQAFRDGEDIYCKFGTQMYGYEITKADKEKRQISKSASLGCGYGMGWKKFIGYAKIIAGVDLTEEEAKNTVASYRRINFHISNFWKECERALFAIANGTEYTFGTDGCCRVDSRGNIWVPGGTRISYPGLRRTKDPETGRDSWIYTSKGKIVFVHPGLVCENIVQMTARNVVAEAILRINKKYFVAGMAHDEVITLIPEAEKDEASAWCHQQMAQPVIWLPNLPVAVEYSVAKRYGEAK